MQSNTRGLMAAVSSLPELTERKRVIDKHTNLATALLQQIKDRGLDQYYNMEEDMLVGKADLGAVANVVRVRCVAIPYACCQLCCLRSAKRLLVLTYCLWCQPVKTNVIVQGDKGTATDRLRLVLVYLLTAESLPSDAELAPIESSLRECFHSLPCLFPSLPHLLVQLLHHSQPIMCQSLVI